MEFQDALIRWANSCFSQGSALRNFRVHIFMFGSNFPWSVLLSNIEIVPLQSFEHFLTSFLWSITVQTMGNCCRFVCFFCLCFYNNIDSIWSPFPSSFLGKSCVREGGNVLCHHDIISLVCTLNDLSSRPISAREIAHLL